MRLDHHTAAGVAEAGELAVLLAGKSAQPAIRAQFIERAGSGRDPVGVTLSQAHVFQCALATRSVWEQMTTDTALRDDDC